jgi:hypothetical protein
MVQVNLKGILARALIDHNPPILSFPIIQKGKYFFLKSGEDIFARLNKQSCTALAKVTTRPFRLHAYMTSEDASVAALESFTDKSLSIEMNAYSSANMADNVGRLLSKSRIFLQPPRYGLEERRYMNPHILQIDGQMNDQVFESTTLSDAEESTGSHSPSDTNLPEDGINVDKIFDMQLQHAFEINVPVDRRIKSSLLQ